MQGLHRLGSVSRTDLLHSQQGNSCLHPTVCTEFSAVQMKAGHDGEERQEKLHGSAALLCTPHPAHPHFSLAVILTAFVFIPSRISAWTTSKSQSRDRRWIYFQATLKLMGALLTLHMLALLFQPCSRREQ